jgi:putative peptidoglycan lipid II flippase
MVNKILNFCERPLVRDTIKTTVWSTVGKAVGFFIPFFIAAWFGVSENTDAFFFAYGLVLFLSGIFAPVVESVIVPYIAEARSKNEDVGKFVGNILGLSGAGLFVLTAFLILVIKPVLSIVTRFDEQTLQLIYQILIETSPLVILLVWTSVLAGTLNAYKKFTFPAISPAFRAVANLIVIFTFKNAYGVHAIAFGYVAGELIRLAVLMIAAKRLEMFKLRWSWKLNTKLKEFIETASYQILGMAAIGLNPIVDKTMASWLDKGSVSVLYYADRLYMIPVSLMSAGLLPVICSHWSEEYYGKKDMYQLINRIKKAVKQVFAASLILFLLLLVLSQPLVHFVFSRGKFDTKYLFLMWYIFVLFLLGLVPYVVGSMFTRGYLVLKKTKFLLKISVFNVCIHAVLNYVCMKFFGISGIALSNSITVLIITCLLFIPFSKNEVF